MYAPSHTSKLPKTMVGRGGGIGILGVAIGTSHRVNNEAALGLGELWELRTAQSTND